MQGNNWTHKASDKF